MFSENYDNVYCTYATKWIENFSIKLKTILLCEQTSKQTQQLKEDYQNQKSHLLLQMLLQISTHTCVRHSAGIYICIFERSVAF